MVKFIIEQKHLINGNKYEVYGDTASDAMLKVYNCSYGINAEDPNFAEYLCQEEGKEDIVGFNVVNIHALYELGIRTPSSVVINYYVKDGDGQHLILATANLGTNTSYLKYLFDVEKRHIQAQECFEYSNYKNGSGTVIHYAYEISSHDKKVEIFEGKFTI
ncbi:hypothetical protein [Aeromonas dhakensis]|uniref:hypothetical protein n=1 Tax=Aeromonas dhakensis TaxID=196024 RepID=UPI00343C4A7E